MGYGLDTITWRHRQHFPIPLKNKCIRPKDPAKEATGLSWNSGRDLLDIASFSKCDNNFTVSSKPQNMNTQFLINGLTEYINAFCILFQEIIQTYNPRPKNGNKKLIMPLSFQGWVHNVQLTLPPNSWTGQQFCLNHRERARSGNWSSNSISGFFSDRRGKEKFLQKL